MKMNYKKEEEIECDMEEVRSRIRRASVQLPVPIFIIFLVLIDVYSTVLNACHGEIPEERFDELLRSVSRAVLLMFTLEMLIRLFGFGFELFKNWMEIVDAVAITVSLIIEFSISSEYSRITLVLRLVRMVRALALFSIRINQLFRRMQELGTKDKASVEMVLDMVTKLREQSTDTHTFDTITQLLTQIQCTLPAFTGSRDDELDKWLANVHGFGNLEPRRSPRRLAFVDNRLLSDAWDESKSEEEKDKVVIIEETLPFIDSPDFDIFNIPLKGSSVLVTVGMSVFRRHQKILDGFNVSAETLKNFLETVDTLYHNNSYHNSIHAADVLQTLHCFLTRGHLENYFDEMEIFSVLLSAVVHDLSHPGVSNDFLIRTGDKLAIRYNDHSVCEHFHVSSAFEHIFTKVGCNPLSNLSPSQYVRCRFLIINMVLSTDMKQHVQNLTMWKSKISAINPLHRQKTSEERLLDLQMLLHAADISNPTKPHHIYQNWIKRVMEEFKNQGQRELDFGYSPSPFCDPRMPVNVNACQRGFIDFVVKPMYQALADFRSELSYPLKQLEHNAIFFQE